MNNRILIVEDESIVALDIQTRLESHGFDVIDICSTGSRAIETAKNSNPDLILMDINLKGSIDGVETASLIRRDLDSPIIFLTAFADEKTIKRATISDASGYILKPFRESELLVTIELAIQRSSVRKKIQENRDWLYGSLNNINDAVITVSEENRVVFLNEKAKEMLDRDVDIGDLFDADQYVVRENQRVFFRKDKKSLDIDYSQRDILDEESVRLGQVHHIQDISSQVEYETGLEKARLAAENSNRAKSDFLANVTHELRTPLNTIIGMNSLISELSQDKDIAEMNGLISNAAESLLGQVNELLDLADIERGMAKIQLSRFSLQTLFDEVLETFRSQVELKSLEICQEIDDIPVLSGDKNKIGDIISCLLSNAVKFTRKGRITIRASYNDGNLLMAFTDTGIGMSEEQRKKIFEQFTQVDSSRTRYFGGVGVGLSLVNKIVTMMEGRIEVESGESEGSTFTVSIPVESSDDQTSQISSDFDRASQYSGSSSDLIEIQKLSEKILECFDKDNFSECESLIRDYREKKEIYDLDSDSQFLFRLSTAVKLKDREKLSNIIKELTEGSNGSIGGIYENSYS